MVSMNVEQTKSYVKSPIYEEWSRCNGDYKICVVVAGSLDPLLRQDSVLWLRRSKAGRCKGRISRKPRLNLPSIRLTLTLTLTPKVNLQAAGGVVALN